MLNQSKSAKHQIVQYKWLKWCSGGLLVVLAIGLGWLYLRGTFRAETQYNVSNAPNLDDPRFPLLVVGLSNALAARGQLTNFWEGADAIYAARLEAIRRAQQTIRFETYYMTPGRRADEFANALIERRKAGVLVQLLVDDFGTDSIPDTYWNRLKAAGVEVRFFRQFDWRAPLDYNSRTHRKLLIIDSREVLIGGAGVSDEWDGDPDSGNQAPWLEFEVRYVGEIASILEGNFVQNWAYDGGSVDLKRTIVQPQSSGDSTLYITNDTSTLSESTIRLLFQASFLAARQRIWIGSPYFVPDEATRRALIQAKQKGVDVRVLTMGENNDKPIVRFASRELYGELLEAGVEICEYQPSMMHAKFALIDNGWVSTGSANFDPRSYHHNDELNVSTSNAQLIQSVDRFFTTALTSSRCLSAQEWRDRPLTEKITGQIGLIAKPLL